MLLLLVLHYIYKNIQYSDVSECQSEVCDIVFGIQKGDKGLGFVSKEEDYTCLVFVL